MREGLIYLRSKKYTQDETASIIGINPRTVQRIEKSLRESKDYV